jgi:hypothetical protein
MSQKYVPMHIYLNPERDEAILTWLAGQKNRSAAVREALSVYLQTEKSNPATSQITTQAVIDPATIYQAIDAALAERLDLGVIRQVVEAAVGQALAGLELSQVSEREDETDSILSLLESNLVLE